MGQTFLNAILNGLNIVFYFQILHDSGRKQNIDKGLGGVIAKETLKMLQFHELFCTVLIKLNLVVP